MRLCIRGNLTLVLSLLIFLVSSSVVSIVHAFSSIPIATTRSSSTHNNNIPIMRHRFIGIATKRTTTSRSTNHYGHNLGNNLVALAAAVPPEMMIDSVSGISDGEIWALRGISAVLSYIGFIGYFDQPRGELLANANEFIEIKTSTVPGAGLGLFAKTTLPRGTILGTYPGVVIPIRQNLEKLRKYPQCEGYIWRFSDNNMVIDPTNNIGNLDYNCRGGNPSIPLSIPIFNSVLSFLSTPSTLCRINEPPIGYDVNVVTNEDIESRTVTFELERDVYAGEEFFIDYGLNYDRSKYGGK